MVPEAVVSGAPAGGAAANDDGAVFHGSLDRLAAVPRFVDAFYDRFIAASPEIREIFAGRDMGRLKRKLRSSLHVMTLAADHAPGADLYLGYLGAVHGRLSIRPEHYDVWLDALVGAVRECDPACDAAVERAWRAVLGQAIALIKAQHPELGAAA